MIFGIFELWSYLKQKELKIIMLFELVIYWLSWYVGLMLENIAFQNLLLIDILIKNSRT